MKISHETLTDKISIVELDSRLSFHAQYESIGSPTIEKVSVSHNRDCRNFINELLQLSIFPGFLQRDENSLLV